MSQSLVACKSYRFIVLAAVLSLAACGPASSAGSSTDGSNVSNAAATLNDPATLASNVVSNFNDNRIKNGIYSYAATTAECMKTGTGVFNCVIHFSDGRQAVQAFTVSEDGSSFMSKNS
jgi:hypothetical protein